MADASRGEELSWLHPTSLLFSIGAVARGLVFPLVAVLIFSRSSQYPALLALGFGAGVFGAMIRFVSFRYRLDEDEIVLRTGLLSRNVRHVPYARIQNIDLVQNPLHRALGVAEVRLETASGDKPEATFRVLSLDAVETMRGHVFRERRARATVAPAGVAEGLPHPDQAATEEPSRKLLQVSTRELLLLGLTSNRGAAIVAAAMGVFWQLDVVQFDETTVERFAPRVMEQVEQWQLPGPLAVAFSVLAGLSFFIVFLKMLSVLRTLVRFHGFTLSRRGDDLRATYGLFTRITVTIPRQRIQLLSIRRGPIHRRFGLASVQVETAGGAEGGEEGSIGKLWLAPMIADTAIGPLMTEVLPEVSIDDPDWQPLAPKAVRRIRNRMLLVGAIACVGAVIGLGPWAGLIFLPAAAFAFLHARLFVRHAGYALTEKAVVYRSGWWRRKLSVVRFAKIQVLGLGQTPFDRRHRMASLQVDTAGAGRIGHRIDIPYLERVRAGGLLDRLSFETGRAPFHW